jgi:hypothetical protein
MIITPTLLSNVLVAVLLLATIGYAIVLNRRLGALRGDRAKLQELIQALTAASTSAQAGIANLRQTTDDLGSEIEKKMAACRGLKDDLTYLIERGGGVADRLEGTVRARRDEPARPGESERKRTPAAPRGASAEKVTALRAEADDDAAPRRAGAAVSRSERDLLRALGGRR